GFSTSNEAICPSGDVPRTRPNSKIFLPMKGTLVLSTRRKWTSYYRKEFLERNDSSQNDKVDAVRSVMSSSTTLRKYMTLLAVTWGPLHYWQFQH
ncbi:MAG: hypothetical protein Q9173_005094, partial [Seirophora scorigena]